MRNRGRGRGRGRGLAAVAGPGAGFAPSSLSGLYAFPIVELMRQAGMLWQDTGQTTLAVADNDPVALFKCTFTGATFTRITDDTHRAILNLASGKSWLTYDGVDDGYSFTGFDSGAASVHFAYRPVGVAAAQIGVVGGNNSFKLKLADTTKMLGGKQAVANWPTLSTTVLVGGTDYVGGANYGATGDGRYFLNGADDGQGVADITTQLPTGNFTRIGISTAASEVFGGRMYGWGLYSAKQAAADIAFVQAFLRTFEP